MTFKHYAIVTVYWEPDERQPKFSQCFTPEWVDKLARNAKAKVGFSHDFVVVTNEDRSSFVEDVVVWKPQASIMPGTHWLLEPYNPFLPYTRCMFVGLDTVFTGDCRDLMALPSDFATIRDPFKPKKMASGVVVWTPGMEESDLLWFAYKDNAPTDFIYQGPYVNPVIRGQMSDMALMNEVIGVPDTWIDDALPGQCLSYKAHVKRGHPIDDCRVLYFHGNPKQHQIEDEWIVKEWR